MIIIVMWVKQSHEPPMTGNGKHITYDFMVMTGDDLLLWRHYRNTPYSK